MYTLHVKPVRGRPFTQPLRTDAFVIGRSRGCDLVLNDEAISRKHARLYREGKAWYVEDLNSRNGTLVDEVPITEPVVLEAHNIVNLSGNKLYIALEDAEADTARTGLLGTGTVLRPINDILSNAEQAELVDPDSLRRHASRLALLNEVHNALSQPITSEALLEMILARVHETLAPEEACIFLKCEEGRLELAGSRTAPGVAGAGIYSQTLVREVSERGLAAIVTDLATDERFNASTSMVNSGIRSLLAAPLMDGEGSMGMIVLASRIAVRCFDEDDMALLVSLASLATLRIRNLSLMEQASRHLRDANAMLERKVAERTAALEKTNEQLRLKNEAILRRQNQLVLQEKMASVGTMAAGVAHLIKNPLNFVKNLSEVSSEMVTELIALLDEADATAEPPSGDLMREILEDLRTNAKIVHNHGTRADQIVVSLMEYAREPSKADCQAADLNALVDKYTHFAVSGRTSDTQAAAIDLSVHKDESVGMVPLFAGDLSRALIAMIHNAVDAVLERYRGPDPDYRGAIDITTRRKEDAVEICIADNGIGIPEAHRRHIFTPFFTTKRDESHIGLGLSIAYDTITQRHRGTIIVTSEVDAGTRFVMTLPIDETTDAH